MDVMKIWRRADGAVRAPWQILIFGLILALVSVVLGGAIYALLLQTPAIEWARLARVPVAEILQAISILAGTIFTARVLDVPNVWAFIGFGRGTWGVRPILVAAGVGVAVIAVPSLLLVAVGAAHFEGATSAQSALFVAWGAFALLVPAALSEELLFRGFAFTVTRNAIGAAWATVLTSVLFGLAHLFNPEPTVLATISVAVAGAFLAAVRIATGSLGAAFVAHLLVNVTQLVILHAPVSGQAFDTPGYRLVPTGPAWLTGGAWGPEGGAAAMVAMLLATFVLLKQKTEGGRQKTVLK
jgi:membrane protease YdiL (CAAX protease family)